MGSLEAWSNAVCALGVGRLAYKTPRVHALCHADCRAWSALHTAQLKASILTGERELEGLVLAMSGRFRTQSAKGRVIAS